MMVRAKPIFDLERSPPFFLNISHLPRQTPTSVITFHDPCHLGRGLGSYEGTRDLMKHVESRWVEMEHHHQESLCCGAGGGVKGFYPEISRDMAWNRVKEAQDVGADILLTDSSFLQAQSRTRSSTEKQDEGDDHARISLGWDRDRKDSVYSKAMKLK